MSQKIVGVFLTVLLSVLILSQACARDGVPKENPSKSSCAEREVWIGTPPKLDHVNFNGSPSDELAQMFFRLAERMPPKQRENWLRHQDKSGEVQNLFPALAEEIIQQRSKPCGQFKEIMEVTHFIARFSDDRGVNRWALMELLTVIREANVAVKQERNYLETDILSGFNERQEF